MQSAEAAAARASQIAAAAMQAGAAAEEAVADAEDYDTASKYAQDLLGSLGQPKPAAAGKRFYGEMVCCTVSSSACITALAAHGGCEMAFRYCLKQLGAPGSSSPPQLVSLCMYC